MRRVISFCSVLVLIFSVTAEPVAALDAPVSAPAEVLTQDQVIPAPEPPVSQAVEPSAAPDTTPPHINDVIITAPLHQEAIPAPSAPPVPPAPVVNVVSPTTIEPNPFPVAVTEAVIVSAFKLTHDKGVMFVELRNTSNAMASVEAMSLNVEYVDAANEEIVCTIPLGTGYVRPQSYVTYMLHSEHDGAYAASGCAVPNSMQPNVTIRVQRDTQPTEIVRIAATAGHWERRGYAQSATNRSGVLATDFKVANREIYTSGLYEVPLAPALQFLEIFPRPVPCSSGDTHATCRPYIKVKNTGTSPIDLAQFRLRNGSLTAQSSRYNTSSLKGVVGSGQTMTIIAAADGAALALNAEDGATWLEDAYGLATYGNMDTPYSDAELVAQTGRSWAFDTADATWKWATPAPYAEENDFTAPGKGAAKAVEASLKPCRDDQYRSEETNRCRSIAAIASSLTPCKEGQYRSEETNRCRSIASGVTAGLKPCRDDQYRSEETNRCRNIATTASSLKPCKDNQYRSEETNRCRNIQASAPPAAAYAVEPLKQGAMSFIGWWALGGVVLSALGYAAWEWRAEIRRGLDRIAHIGRRK